jgi:hypothetical protein
VVADRLNRTVNMGRHTISHAAELYSGDAQYGAANNALRGVPLTPLLHIALGSPAVADVDGIAVAQAVAGAGNLTLTAGAASLDVARNITIDSAGAGDTTQTATVTGTDIYGVTMVEDIAFNGTTEVAGLKAFKTVTQVAIDAATAGNVNVGFGDVLGLPYRVDENGLIMAYADGALDLTTSAVLGTFAPAVTTDPATGVTGDVRGTYNPNTTLDGTVEFAVLIKVASVETKVGAFGVDQFGG